MERSRTRARRNLWLYVLRYSIQNPGVCVPRWQTLRANNILSHFVLLPFAPFVLYGSRFDAAPVPGRGGFPVVLSQATSSGCKRPFVSLRSSPPRVHARSVLFLLPTSSAGRPGLSRFCIPLSALEPGEKSLLKSTKIDEGRRLFNKGYIRLSDSIVLVSAQCMYGPNKQIFCIISGILRKIVESHCRRSEFGKE